METRIKKQFSPHILRHSFPTYWLEADTDLRYVQKLLGHNSSKTTEIYAQVVANIFISIKNPLDLVDIYRHTFVFIHLLACIKTWNFMKWSFNRIKDKSKIKSKIIEWKGPYSWPKFEDINSLEALIDKEAVYLMTFEFNDGYLIAGVGITKSTKRRFSEHTRAFKKGNYTILDVKSASNGERKEIWHGWDYAKNNQDEFKLNKEKLLKSVDLHLAALRIFIAEEPNVRIRERIEAAIMHNIYVSKEPWSELADRGMFLRERFNSELPILNINKSIKNIYGLPSQLEI